MPTRNDERMSGIESTRDRIEIAEVMMRAFNQGPQMERLLLKSRLRGPYGQPEHTRVLRTDGRVVCAAVTAPRNIRFGPVAVPAITVGPVGTHDAYRKRGYAARVMEEVSRAAREQGALVAYLQGIADFYFRFGYYPFAAYGMLKFDRAEAEKVAAKGRARMMTKKDLSAVAHIYDRVTAGRNCAAKREPALWPELFQIRKVDNLLAEPRVILDASGKLVGYFTRTRGDRLHAPECAVLPDEASFRAALGALVRLAKQREDKQITLRVPYDDPFCVFARQHLSADYEFDSHHTGGLVMVILDFPKLLRRIVPMFTERVKAMPAPPPKTVFTLKTDIGAVALEVTRAGVRVLDKAKGPRVVVPRRWLSGLLTGHWTPDDIAPRDGVRLPAKLMPLLRALFPRAWPFVYQGDNY